MSQEVSCPSCNHSFIPMSYEVTNYEEHHDGDVVYLMLWAGLDDMGTSAHIKLEKDETVIIGKGKNAREEQREIVWDDERIRARIIRRLNEHAASRQTPAKRANVKSIVGEKGTLSYGA